MTRAFVRIAATLVLLAGAAFSQSPASTPATSPQAPPATTLLANPVRTVIDQQDAAPLTPGQKFELFARQTSHPLSFVGAAATAGIGQADDSFHEYGQGGEGYSKRFGAAMADQADYHFMTSFLYPALLKQDPRYFRLGEGSFGHRLGYALKQEFEARSDKGTRQFNYSRVLGTFTAAGISNAYYPEPDRGFGVTMGRAGAGLAFGMLGQVGNEFWPDIKHKLFHKDHKTQ